MHAAVLFGRQGLACGLSVLQVKVQALEAVDVPPTGAESPTQRGVSPCTRAPVGSVVPQAASLGGLPEGYTRRGTGQQGAPRSVATRYSHVGPYVNRSLRGVSSQAREVTHGGELMVTRGIRVGPRLDRVVSGSRRILHDGQSP